MNRNIRLLYIHNFLTDFRFQTAFMVIYFAQILGSYAAAMSILAVENIVSAFMDIPTGMISDRIGRKATLTLGSVCSALGVASYACAGALPLVLAGAFLSGLGGCLFNGNNNALLFETLKAEGIEDQFHHYQGRTSSMFQLALGISALCSSLMTARGLRFIFIAGIVPQILSIFVTFCFNEPRIHMPSEHKGLNAFTKSLTQVWGNKKLRLLMFGQAISYGAGEATFNFRNAYINSLWPIWALGVYRSMNNALGFLGFWFSGHLIDRFKAPRILAIAETYWLCANMTALLLSNVITPVILLTGASLYGPFTVARDQLLQSEFADEQRATMGSVASFMGSLFYAVMAVGIGSISDHYGLLAGMASGVVMTAAALPVYIRLFRRYFLSGTTG